MMALILSWELEYLGGLLSAIVSKRYYCRLLTIIIFHVIELGFNPCFSFFVFRQMHRPSFGALVHGSNHIACVTPRMELQCIRLAYVANPKLSPSSL